MEASGGHTLRAIAELTLHVYCVGNDTFPSAPEDFGGAARIRISLEWLTWQAIQRCFSMQTECRSMDRQALE